MGVMYKASDGFELTAFIDSDSAKCVVTKRSVTGYAVFLGSFLVSWKMEYSIPVYMFCDSSGSMQITANPCVLDSLSGLGLMWHGKGSSRVEVEHVFKDKGLNEDRS
ncbi:hypothetical protein Tco_0868684 [Tanacetum coccineum]